jgi:hypothetical protein
MTSCRPGGSGSSRAPSRTTLSSGSSRTPRASPTGCAAATCSSGDSYAPKGASAVRERCERLETGQRERRGRGPARAFVAGDTADPNRRGAGRAARVRRRDRGVARNRTGVGARRRGVGGIPERPSVLGGSSIGLDRPVRAGVRPAGTRLSLLGFRVRGRGGLSVARAAVGSDERGGGCSAGAQAEQEGGEDGAQRDRS